MEFLLKHLKTLRRILVGSQLEDAAERHAEATDRLDQALREVLKK